MSTQELIFILYGFNQGKKVEMLSNIRELNENFLVLKDRHDGKEKKSRKGKKLQYKTSSLVSGSM